MPEMQKCIKKNTNMGKHSEVNVNLFFFFSPI